MQTTTPDVFNAFVHITDEAGRTHAFGPGDPIPDWTRRHIGDHVIYRGGFSENDESPEAVAAMAQALEAPNLVTRRPMDEDDGMGVVVPPEPPPTSGPGSGQQAWFAYAQAVGETEPTSSWTRQDLMDLLIRRGHITD